MKNYKNDTNLKEQISVFIYIDNDLTNYSAITVDSEEDAIDMINNMTFDKAIELYSLEYSELSKKEINNIKSVKLDYMKENDSFGSNEIIIKKPLTDKEKRVLENIRLEMLEDLTEFGLDCKIALIFKEYKDEYYFTDYDVYDEKTTIEYDEAYKIVTIKEALYFICDIMYPEIKNDIITIWVNLWVKDITSYKLAQELKVSKQFLSNILNGNKPLPRKYYEEIATFLEFDITEYDRTIDNEYIPQFMI